MNLYNTSAGVITPRIRCESGGYFSYIGKVNTSESTAVKTDLSHTPNNGDIGVGKDS